MTLRDVDCGVIEDLYVSDEDESDDDAAMNESVFKWGEGEAETTGLSFVCFVVINPRVLSANRVDLGFFFCFIHFSILPSF